MLELNSLISFLGWCCVINIGILCFTSISIVAFKTSISRIHGNMFGIKESDLMPLYFGYLANYKVLIIIFNIVPYIALKLIS